MSMKRPWGSPMLSVLTPVSILPRRSTVACCVALACAVAGSLLVSATALASTTYKYHEHITGFPAPSGLASCGGNVYVSDTELGVVDEYNSSGTYIGQITGAAAGASEFTPAAIAINCAGGDIYVDDIHNKVVDEFSDDFAVAEKYIGQITGAATGSVFQTLTGVGVNGHGVVYVADHIIERENSYAVVDEFDDDFAAAEKYLGQITGHGGEKFETVSAVAVSPANNLYVANFGKNAVEEFTEPGSNPSSEPGTFVGKVTGLDTKAKSLKPNLGLAFDGSEDVLVVDYPHKVIDIFKPTFGSGEEVVGEITGEEVENPNPENIGFGTLTGLAVNGINGYVYVGDETNEVVDVFSPVIPKYTLSVTKNGSGSGTVECNTGSGPGPCAAEYNEGTVVKLTESAGGGSTFAGWSEACSGTGSCEVTMTGARSVTATFNLQPTYKTCAKGEKIEGRYTGKFLDKYCEEPATKAQEEEGRLNKFELTNIVLPSTFTGKSATTTFDFYEGATLKYEVECKKSTSEGEITGESTDSEVITYSKCKGKEEPGGTTVACENTARETIASESLASQLVDEGGKVYDRLTGKGTEFAEFKCGSTTFKVSGSVLGEVGAEQINTASKSGTITFSAADHGLSAEIGGTSGYTGGVEGEETRKGAKLYIELP